jgi:8-oxo-(d)GTP phosphatase
MHMLALVRHAIAEDRQGWRGDDARRPLTARGRTQSLRLADLLERMLDGVTLVALRSSPALRCVQTLEPLAERVGAALEIDQGLMEGRKVSAPSPREDGAFVLCAHGDNIPWLLEDLGIDWDGRCKKGSVWVVQRDGRGKVTESAYHALPKE